MGFPTKNDQHLGCEMGVPPFKETPNMMFPNQLVKLGYLCFEVHSLHEKGLCIIGPRALELLNVVVINIWYGSPRVGAG